MTATNEHPYTGFVCTDRISYYEQHTLHTACAAVAARAKNATSVDMMVHRGGWGLACPSMAFGKMKRVDGNDVLFEKVCVVANPGAVHPG